MWTKNPNDNPGNQQYYIQNNGSYIAKYQVGDKTRYKITHKGHTYYGFESSDEAKAKYELLQLSNKGE